jgi:ribosomal protein S18 acetylase RimI-like enzyme
VPVEIRRIRADDFALARTLRLAALADAPTAFSSRLEDEQAFAESVWRARAASNEEGLRTVGFFAVVDGAAQGLVVGILGDPVATRAELVSMWIAPAARGRGAARALVEAVCAWARARGCREVTLEVTDANAPARALYRSCGFVETAMRRPFPNDSSLTLIEAVRVL